MLLKRLLPPAALALGFGLLLCLMLQTARQLPVKTDAVPSVAAKNVLIDPGHGGADGGAVVGEVLEKEINLAIARDIADYLTLCGYHVRMTRQTDDAVTDEGKDIRSRKVNDMKERLKMVNSSPEQVVISVHQNKFSAASSKGAQVFYAPNHPDSARLAESIRGVIVSSLQPDNGRECKAAGKEIYLLYNAKVPAVLVECGFLSNREERGLLVTESYQKQMATAVAAGLFNYCQQ